MNRVFRMFDAWVCSWKGHKWGRAYPTALQTGEYDRWVKRCRRCHAIAPVKRRAKKEAK